MREAAAQPGHAAPPAAGGTLDRLMARTGVAPETAGHADLRRGLAAVLGALADAPAPPTAVGAGFVDAMIAELDARIGRQLDAVLHHPRLQRLEAAWRSVRFVVEHADPGENTVVELLDVAKDDLLADFEDAPEVAQSGLYRLVYSAEYGTFGGEPYAAMIADYEFGPGPQDVALLQKVAAVATMAHAPFIAGASPRMFGLDSYARLPAITDLPALMQGPQYAKWNAFRASEDARSVALALPRFLLRLPWGGDGAPVRGLAYAEDVAGRHDAWLWGNAAFAFATRLADSFARWRWCPNIIGPQGGGAVAGLITPHSASLGAVGALLPVEVLISERREWELAEEGFIPLALRPGAGEAAFFSANSCQRPKTFGISDAGRAAALNHRLGTQLPYLFIVNRLAHYIKVLQREHVGAWKERGDLQRELGEWLGRFVVDMDDPAPDVRNRRPLRGAEITVDELPGDAGWYRVALQVRPHFKYMGASFTLSLVGKLDKDR